MLSLGINLSHDSSACIVKDDEIIAAIAEERLSRIKHDNSFPTRAINACLELAGIGESDLDFVTFGSPHFTRFLLHEMKAIALGHIPLAPGLFGLARFAYWSRLRARDIKAFLSGTRAEVRLLDHHLAHAVHAYALSGFETAAVAIIDGRGASESTTIWHGRGGRLDPVMTIPWPNSLGLFYEVFTSYLGFRALSDEWKVMGLAPYGRTGVNLDRVIDLRARPYRVASRPLLATWPRKHRHAGVEPFLGPARRDSEQIQDRHRDVAFAVQHACEQAMLAIAAMAISKTGESRLCLGGGVAMNAKANGAILDSGVASELFVPPAAADDGTAVGAALSPYLERGGRLPVKRVVHAFWGPAYDDDIKAVLNRYKLNYRELDSPPEQAADALAAGRIIGWFQGRMEFGERALGSRSILADPRQPGTKDRLNDAVKFRESWRPFAPSIQLEAAPEYLAGARESPFMTTTFDVRAERQEELGAVTHVDGTTRPQTVDRETSPLFWELIEGFRKRTGVPAVLNTSFNLQGEPIVCTPEDAIRSFFTSGLDALILGNFLVEK